MYSFRTDADTAFAGNGALFWAYEKSSLLVHVLGWLKVKKGAEHQLSEATRVAWRLGF